MKARRTQEQLTIQYFTDSAGRVWIQLELSLFTAGILICLTYHVFYTM